MSTANGKSYSNIKNLNLKGGVEGTGLLKWSQYPAANGGPSNLNWSSNPFNSSEVGLYINSLGNLVYSYLGSAITLGAAGGGGAVPTWNNIFANSQTMSVQGTAFTIQDTTGTSNNVLSLVASSTSGALLTFAQSGSGNDILGTSSSWSVSKAGAATFLSVTSATYTGAGAVAISANGSSAITIGSGSNTIVLAVPVTFSSTIVGTSESLVSTSNTVVPLLVTNNTITTFGHQVASGGALVVRSTSLTTGTLIRAQLAEAALTTGFYFEAWDTTASATVFSVAKTGATTINGADGSTVFTITNGDVSWNGASSLTISDNDNAATLSVTNNTATTANVFLFTGSGVFTGTGASSFFNITQSGLTTGTAATIITAGLTTGKALDISATAQTTGALINLTGGGANITTGGALIAGSLGAATAGNGITLATTGIYIGTGLLTITANSATTGTLASITGNGLTTGIGFLVTSSGVIATTGNLVSLVATGLTTGTALNFGTLAALTTGAGIKIAHTTSVIADGGSLVRLSSSSVDTGGSTNGTLLDLGNTGATAATTIKYTDTALTTGVALNLVGSGVYTGTGYITITHSAATTGVIMLMTLAGLTTGSAISVAANALTTGKLVNLTHTTSVIAAGGAMLHISSTSIDTSTTTGALLNLSSTASTAGTQMLLTASALTTGIAASIVTAALTTGAALSITANALTSGNGLAISSSSADTTARGLIQLTASSASAIGTSAIRATLSKQSTHFVRLITESTTGVTLWLSDGTTAQGNLSGTTGDICFNAGSNKPEYCTGTTSWTALV